MTDKTQSEVVSQLALLTVMIQLCDDTVKERRKMERREKHDE